MDAQGSHPIRHGGLGSAGNNHLGGSTRGDGKRRGKGQPRYLNQPGGIDFTGNKELEGGRRIVDAVTLGEGQPKLHALVGDGRGQGISHSPKRDERKQKGEGEFAFRFIRLFHTLNLTSEPGYYSAKSPEIGRAHV